MVKALVTGGTGFVGSHVARMLDEQGHDVRVLHRTSSRLIALDGVKYESITGDLDDVDVLRDACAGVEWVFHVAAVSDYWRSDKARLLEINVEGTRRVLQAANDADVKRVVFTSSGWAVGLRDDGQPSNETTAFNFPPDFSAYAYSKMLAEKVVDEHVSKGQDIVTVNPVIVMGPGDLNMISGTFMTQIKRLGLLVPVTSGGAGFTDVRDVARGHIAAAEKGRIGERYILGTANYTYAKWYKMIAETIDVAHPRFRTPDFMAPITANLISMLRKLRIPTPVDESQARMSTTKVYFDYSKSHSELCKPQIDMMQSLHDTYAWYKEHGYMK